MKKILLSLAVVLTASYAQAGTGSDTEQNILSAAKITATFAQQRAIDFTLDRIKKRPISVKKITQLNQYVTSVTKYGMVVTSDDVDDFVTTYSHPKRYIVVNIPAFMLYVIEDDKVVFSSKVIVGKGNKRTTKTPELNTNITHVGWNPYWAPPYNYSITKTIAGWKKDKNYLRKNDLSVIRNKDHSFLTNAELTEAVFRSTDHTIVQTPGDDNMLGKALFFLDNKEDVYMHDTNRRDLFKHDRRNFSLGCIRVQQWLQLASWVTKWDNTKIMGEIDTGDLIFHNLPKQVPVFVVYWPADVVDGKVVYYTDLYNWIK